jgi:hypothetical protein
MACSVAFSTKAVMVMNVWYNDKAYKKMGLVIGTENGRYLINPYSPGEIVKRKKSEIEVVPDEVLAQKQ